MDVKCLGMHVALTKSLKKCQVSSPLVRQAILQPWGQ